MSLNADKHFWPGSDSNCFMVGQQRAVAAVWPVPCRSPGQMEGAGNVEVLTSDRLVRSSGPVDTERRALRGDAMIFTSSFRPEGMCDLYFRELVNKPT